ncbi:MAG: DNA polymerase III subunit alpha, partial [Chloroflexota bacterium]|nr:DNA polymerase III subunit alpha [Chloroflexota bacterium]
LNKRAGLLTFLAMDRKGWSNLCRLSSAALSEPYYPAKLPVPCRIIAENSQGLICLTGGCLTGGGRGLVTDLIARGAERAAGTWLGHLADIFHDRMYIELQHHRREDVLWNARLCATAERMSLPTVATHSVHYLSPAQAALQRVVSGIRMNMPHHEVLDNDELAAPEAHFLTQEDMRTRFAQAPAAIQATIEIAERCHADLPLGESHFPEVPVPDGKTAIGVLRTKAERGARNLYGSVTPDISQRLDSELSVIEQSGYAPLFLVMEEIVSFTQERDIPISSRGSAASSLVAHCLGITSPDPMRLNLYFERFLNPARATPPDIDTDLCSRRRDEVIQFVYDRFGADRAAMVCTINRFRIRSAFREVAKAFGLSTSETKEMADLLPGRWYGPPSLQERSSDPFESLRVQYPSSSYQKIFDHAGALLGSPRHLSIHPGGMVITPDVMTELVPTQLASKGITITQFDLEAIERLGLVKIDLLGIRGLTVLNDVAAKAGRERPGRVIRFLEAIPTEDPAAATLVESGGTIGCFQIESPGMRATLKEIRARSVDDIMVALALYRPGPLTGGLKDAFVRRHNKLEPTAYLHPSLEPLLADTYGVILYQEQVLRIAHELAGLSLSDADLLRRAMSHFDPGKQMQTLEGRFVSGAYEHNQVPEDIAKRIWELMAAFAGYGFPKAHAASYAQVAWRSAWCKTHYPALFLAAVLANWGGYYSQRVYLLEARRLGLAIRPPDIQHARREFSVSYLEGQPVLFMGLDQVRDLTRRTQQRIL